MAPHETAKEIPHFKLYARSHTHAFVMQLIRLIDVIRFLLVSLIVSATIDGLWNYVNDEDYRTLGNLAFRGYMSALIYNYGCPLVGKFTTFLIQTFALSGLIISYQDSIESYTVEQLYTTLYAMARVAMQLFIKFIVLNFMERRMVTHHVKNNWLFCNC